MNKTNNTNYYIYTYHLPYAIRRDICNLLDADQSWRTLGGQFMGLDGTQLTLLGQAYMRNGSPTGELFNKLDSANLKIEKFCDYLKQMNQIRAVELLKPYILTNFNNDLLLIKQNNNSTLDTPTPSFTDLPQPMAAIMDVNNPFELSTNLFKNEFNPFQSNSISVVEKAPPPPPPSKCHKNTTTKTIGGESILLLNDEQSTKNKLIDPGEEIVRMACVNNRKRTSISDQEVVNQLRLIMQITYNELKQASDNFSDLNKIGNGGFASVYRGNWKGTDVAIKRLKCNLMDQALNELTILNSYRIDNILPIYGISIDGPEACLVYQFMSNGSLEDRLACKMETPPLNWKQRELIAEGVAKGLYYLHTLRDKPLVHGDVKSANVLLDSQLIPKLGDFGLARQVFKGKNPSQNEQSTHCTVSTIHGTSVYLPPEYLRHKILSSAVDVYSYGIVLLEMATGKRAYDGKRLLIDFVEDETNSMSVGQISYNLKDSRLINDSQEDLKIWYELLIKLGLNCAHKIKKKRLDMGQVLNCFNNFRNSNSNNNNNINSSMINKISNNYFNGERNNLQNQEHIVNQGQQQNIINNSSLMIVEEEEQQQQKQEQINAMIPLVTELGVVAKNE